ncbi:lysophospholipase [Caenispirillum salinarum]|uniref:alpha/beta hydrolase n=1 Tax=Caenispirillum salinarum TaxID=859058 RepID=UPI00384CB7CA
MRGRSYLAAGLVLGALALTGCAPSVVPPGPLAEAPQRPALTQDSFRTADGYALPVRSWLPEGKPQAVVLAVHGFNDYSHGFDLPGRALSAKGIAVWSFDQRGFGSAPHFGLWPGEDAMIGDISGMARALKARHPDVPLYLLGVSMGGAAVIATATSDDPPPHDGVILSAPAVWARDTMPFYQRAGLFIASHTVPWMKLSGEGLGYQASDNLEILRAAGRDPLFIKETRIDSTKGLVDLMDRAMDRVDEVPGPVLYLYGEKDEIVPPHATDRALETVPDRGGRVRVVLYDDGWHMLLRDLQRETVYADILAWIADRQGPLPSGEEVGPAVTVAQEIANNGDGSDDGADRPGTVRAAGPSDGGPETAE